MDLDDDADVMMVRAAVATRWRNRLAIAAVAVHLALLVSPYFGLVTLPVSALCVVLAAVAQAKARSGLDGMLLAIVGIGISLATAYVFAILGEMTFGYDSYWLGRRPPRERHTTEEPTRY